MFIAGKGTSARDGAALAGALLEHLDSIQCLGVFATHLHELFRLPLQLSNRIEYKKMGVNINLQGIFMTFHVLFMHFSCTFHACMFVIIFQLFSFVCSCVQC